MISRGSGPLGLSLIEYEQRFGADAIVFHRLRRRVGLHELLKLVHVGNLSDEPDPVGSLRVVKGADRNAQRSKHFLSFRRLQPMLDVVDLMEYDVRWHALLLPHGGRRARTVNPGAPRGEIQPHSYTVPQHPLGNRTAPRGRRKRPPGTEWVHRRANAASAKIEHQR